MEARGAGKRDFLWIDEDPQRRERVRRGEVVIGGDGPRTVPAGLIHHGVGAVFIPNATLDQVFHVVEDYDHYKHFYSPGVADSHALANVGDRRRFSMRWLKKVLFVTAVFDTEHEIRSVQLKENRWYSVDRTTRIQQIENYGQQDERKLSPDRGNGYLWRMYSISRFEEQDGGVYLETEVIGLSRDVPAGFRWMLNPIIRRLPRTLLLTTLEQTRSAVLELQNMSN
jgi:hypothetical protein